MPQHTLGRRRFAGALSAAFGGAFLAPHAARAASTGAAQAAGTATARLNSNENPYGPSPRALEAMTRALAVAARYPDVVEDELTAALARMHGVTTGQVILGCGSGEILRMADLASLAAGKTVVVAEPTFEAVLLYARITRAESVKVPLDAHRRHDLDAMARACDARTGLVYVCNPNNPTGTIVSAAALAAFVERVPRTATVLVDEAYHHFVESAEYGSACALLARHDNLVVVRTFSKIYGLAGMRLGYAVGSEQAIEGLRQHAFASNVNAAVAAAGLASLEDEDHVARTRRRMNDTRRWLCRELEADGRSYIPSETNFVMIDVGADVAPVIAALRERGLFVGRRFPAMARWLRVSIGTQEEIEAFVKGLREVVPTRAAAA